MLLFHQIPSHKGMDEEAGEKIRENCAMIKTVVSHEHALLTLAKYHVTSFHSLLVDKAP